MLHSISSAPVLAIFRLDSTETGAEEAGSLFNSTHDSVIHTFSGWFSSSPTTITLTAIVASSSASISLFIALSIQTAACALRTFTCAPSRLCLDVPIPFVTSSHVHTN
ncbi:hypothetical protein FRC12_022840 [Ceratobasidium sp. 428]|nr:hypothetical protein FRC12_022840 [Ceratobasidium sp. 428]